jgi:hypothetical protein
MRQKRRSSSAGLPASACSSAARSASFLKPSSDGGTDSPCGYVEIGNARARRAIVDGLYEEFCNEKVSPEPFPDYKRPRKHKLRFRKKRRVRVIETETDLGRGATAGGVRIGAGSAYDWVVEEIFAADGGPAMVEAMQLLAQVRRRRAISALVERAFYETEREMREGLRRGGPTLQGTGVKARLT